MQAINWDGSSICGGSIEKVGLAGESSRDTLSSHRQGYRGIAIASKRERTRERESERRRENERQRGVRGGKCGWQKRQTLLLYQLGREIELVSTFPEVKTATGVLRDPNRLSYDHGSGSSSGGGYGSGGHRRGNQRICR